jgi:hypothetical protein
MAAQNEESLSQRYTLLGLPAEAAVGVWPARLIGQSVLGSQGVGLGGPGALRALIGVGVYLACSGSWLSVSARVIRRSAGASAVLVALLLISPALAHCCPAPSGARSQSSCPTSPDKPSSHHRTHHHPLTVGRPGRIRPYAAATLGIAITVVRHCDAWNSPTLPIPASCAGKRPLPDRTQGMFHLDRAH